MAHAAMWGFTDVVVLEETMHPTNTIASATECLEMQEISVSSKDYIQQILYSPNKYSPILR